MISELLRLSTLSTSSLNFGLAWVKVQVVQRCHNWQWWYWWLLNYFIERLSSQCWSFKKYLQGGAFYCEEPFGVS